MLLTYTCIPLSDPSSQLLAATASISGFEAIHCQLLRTTGSFGEQRFVECMMGLVL